MRTSGYQRRAAIALFSATIAFPVLSAAKKEKPPPATYVTAWNYQVPCKTAWTALLHVAMKAGFGPKLLDRESGVMDLEFRNGDTGAPDANSMTKMVTFAEPNILNTVELLRITSATAVFTDSQAAAGPGDPLKDACKCEFKISYTAQIHTVLPSARFWQVLESNGYLESVVLNNTQAAITAK